MTWPACSALPPASRSQARVRQHGHSTAACATTSAQVTQMVYRQAGQTTWRPERGAGSPAIQPSANHAAPPMPQAAGSPPRAVSRRAALPLMLAVMRGCAASGGRRDSTTANQHARFNCRFSTTAPSARLTAAALKLRAEKQEKTRRHFVVRCRKAGVLYIRVHDTRWTCASSLVTQDVHPARNDEDTLAQPDQGNH